MSDDLRRLETLERLVRHLSAEVAALRAEVRGTHGREGAREALRLDREPRPSPAPFEEPRERPLHEPTPRERMGFLRRGDGAHLEKLVGRYGTVALAVLTIVMGVGVFLRWAIEHVEVGPVQRVALGTVGALAVGAFGWRLRSRGARQYGNMLVGLSLALVHVVAWGAGPYLRVVPDTVALTIAAAASALLAVLAWREGEQPLFAAGLGGAFLAPFVTTRGGDSPEALLAYGGAIVLPATLALRGGDWRVARRIVAMGTLLFAGAALAVLPDGGLWWRMAEAPAFALAAALVAQLAAGERHRRALAYTHLASALVVLVAYAAQSPPVWMAAGLGLAGAALAALASRGEGDHAGGAFELRLSTTGSFSVGAPPGDPVPWVGATGFPLAFMGVAIASLAVPVSVRGSLIAAAFAVVTLACAALGWARGPSRRGAHLVAAGFAGAIAILLAAYEQPLALTLGLAGLGAACSLLAARTATPLALVPALFALALTTVTAAIELARRPAWEYTPFLTPASLAAFAAVAGWWIAARATAALATASLRAFGAHGRERAARGVDDAAVLRAVAYAVAFAWGHQELRHAGSPAIATFLLVAYYATVGVATIGLGRWRGSAAARRVGLGLAVLAALKAITQASTITGVGMRVGSYLLVGGFLLGVAWWYRSGDGEDGAEATAGDAAGDTPAPASARAVHNAP